MLCRLFEVFDCLPPLLRKYKFSLSVIHVFLVSVRQYSVYVCCVGYVRSLIASTDKEV